MATTIATLTQRGDSFEGMLHTLAVKAPISLIPNPRKRSDAAPDYLVTCRGFELGGGWKRTGKDSGEDYVSVSIASPEIGRLFGNLVKAPGDDPTKKVILWNPTT